MVGTLFFGSSFPFFHTTFSTRFLSFFFVFFHVFLFFVHFFIFLCFSFSFFIFSEEKVSSFLFSCVSCKYFLLLASVSEFNCFFQSRCSMEMWCPDGDSWDWVAPPAWGRACFNSPEWGGGSSPVKPEPPQIVLLLLLFWRRHSDGCVCPHTLSINSCTTGGLTPGRNSRRQRHPRALDDEELFIIEGSPTAETAARLRDNPEEREKGAKCAKNPSAPSLRDHRDVQPCR